MTRSRLKQFVLVLGVLISAPTIAAADESGVSFWIPGFFGSLAAAPMQPGWTLQTNYYHTSVSAGADVARSLDIRIGRIPINLNANVSATVDARADLGWAMPLYTFATPVLGGQATVGVLGLYGRVSTSIAGTLAGTLTTPLGTTPFASSANTSDSVSGFGDVLPIATLRWNAGAHNYMTYITGDVPVGAYDSTRISNIGLGHGTIDAGGGYTYFDPQTGHEFSGILGFTYNFENQSDQYQSGVDMHFDWSVSQFVTKQFQIGAVGYVYKEIGCDSGSGDRVGCFQSQVVGVGPQLGFIFPVGDLQGYLNLKYYSEFAAENRPHGWNTWVTFTISPAVPSPSTSTPKRIITK
ncbi:MAG TPA: transporter [Bradyrhizobium sp.]|nr:transporter [Bradyrhizobium sp.]